MVAEFVFGTRFGAVITLTILEFYFVGQEAFVAVRLNVDSGSPLQNPNMIRSFNLWS